MAIIWTALDYIVVCNFWKSPFFCRYNANFFWKLIEPNFFENIFGISCWLLFA